MRVRVDSAITFPLSEATPTLIAKLDARLSFPNPACLAQRRMGRRAIGLAETLHFLGQRDGIVRIPRGAIHLLRELAAQEGIVVKCEDRRVLPEERLACPDNLPLRDYQREGIDRLCTVTQGTAIMSCGSGKSLSGVGAIARLKTPSLVLVHTLDLAEQWCAHIRERLDMEPGVVGGGECRIRPLTVGVVQSLTRWAPPKLDEFLSRFGLLITDEAHHCPGVTFRDIIDRTPAKYRFGLTATKEREDGLSPLLDLYFGPPLIEVPHERLIAAGVLTVPQVRAVRTDFKYDYAGAESYAPMLDAIANDEARNRLIVHAVIEQARAGNTCLVLSGRVDHCDHLASAISEQGIAAAALTSKVKRDRRKALLDDARAGKQSVLIATSLADEGLDVPRLSRVFLAYPSRARGRTVQRLGRLMRPHPDKKDAILFDFVDHNVPILWRHHIERKRMYAEVLRGAGGNL